MTDMEYKIKSVMLGHAVADALGVPVEFCSREELDENPVKDMEGFGTYPYPAGCWSDDTSMSLAALDSLADGRLDYDEIMQNFGKWYGQDEYTPTGVMFDIGNACSRAIQNYFVLHKKISECGLTDDNSNGNGSLMRIHPFVLFTCFVDCKDLCLDIIHAGSAITHAHRCSQLGCGIYAFVLRELLTCPDKESVSVGLKKAWQVYHDDEQFGRYHRLFDTNFKKTDRGLIKSTGYIVDTLEAAIWCLLNTDSYADCVLKAVNLGEDTDTVAAVAGGLAGALYGYDAIDGKWLATLKRREYIEEMCERASKNWEKRGFVSASFGLFDIAP